MWFLCRLFLFSFWFYILLSSNIFLTDLFWTNELEGYLRDHLFLKECFFQRTMLLRCMKFLFLPNGLSLLISYHILLKLVLSDAIKCSVYWFYWIVSRHWLWGIFTPFYWHLKIFPPMLEAILNKNFFN